MPLGPVPAFFFDRPSVQEHGFNLARVAQLLHATPVTRRARASSAHAHTPGTTRATSHQTPVHQCALAGRLHRTRTRRVPKPVSRRPTWHVRRGSTDAGSVCRTGPTLLAVAATLSVRERHLRAEMVPRPRRRGRPDSSLRLATLTRPLEGARGRGSSVAHRRRQAT